MSPQMHQRDCTMRREQWRNRYESSWTEAAECETRLRFDLERLTGQVVEFCDAGAGEKDRTVGTGKRKASGVPDLAFRDFPLCVEVTGPKVPVKVSEPLWIRPDKVLHARRTLLTRWTLVVHEMHDGLRRGILLDEAFFRELVEGRFPFAGFHNKGMKERFLAVGADSDVVMTWERTVDRVRGILAAVTTKPGRLPTYDVS